MVLLISLHAYIYEFVKLTQYPANQRVKSQIDPWKPGSSDQFFLFGIHRDHRIPSSQVFGDLSIEMSKLGIPIFML